MNNTTLSDAANWLRDNGYPLQEPSFAVVCGSGLAQAMGDFVDIAAKWPYSAIPGMPEITVEGHSPKLKIVNFKSGKGLALVFSGRTHLYEGIRKDELLFQVRLANALGIKKIIITCSVGSINSRTPPGSLGLIVDQIDFQQYARFRYTKALERESDLYDRQLISILIEAASDIGIPLIEGLFCSVLGPSFETPAEITMLQRLGVDWVSMSTSKEAREASALGMQVAGITGVSNYITPCPRCGEARTSHEDVLEAAKISSKALWKLLLRVSADLC